ncbi:MAG: hypothetical protein ACRENX_11020 [Candidatus Dormibacteria bacterium]
MSKIPPFHADVSSPRYNPREVEIFHNQSGCGYGHLVERDGQARAGNDSGGIPEVALWSL